MGSLSIAWYVVLTILSENILFDSIAALGLMISEAPVLVVPV